jgi:hypothetical protein
VQKIAAFLILIAVTRQSGAGTGGDDEQIGYEWFEWSKRARRQPNLLWYDTADRSAIGLLVRYRPLESAPATDRQHHGGIALACWLIRRPDDVEVCRLHQDHLALTRAGLACG